MKYLMLITLLFAGVFATPGQVLSQSETEERELKQEGDPAKACLADSNCGSVMSAADEVKLKADNSEGRVAAEACDSGACLKNLSNARIGDDTRPGGATSVKPTSGGPARQ